MHPVARRFFRRQDWSDGAIKRPDTKLLGSEVEGGKVRMIGTRTWVIWGSKRYDLRYSTAPTTISNGLGYRQVRAEYPSHHQYPLTHYLTPELSPSGWYPTISAMIVYQTRSLSKNRSRRYMTRARSLPTSV